MKLYVFEQEHYLVKRINKYYGLQGTMCYKTKLVIKYPTTLGKLLGKEAQFMLDSKTLKGIIEKGYTKTSKEHYEECYGVEVDPIAAEFGLEGIFNKEETDD